MDKNIEDIEKYKKVFDDCLDKNKTIKSLVSKGWFVEWIVVGIIIWQFFVIYKLHEVLTVIQSIQYDVAMATGQVIIMP